MSFTSGAMDVIAFMLLGEIFTSAMSGNTALLGVSIGEGKTSSILHAIAAVGGYVAGAALAAGVFGRDRCIRGKLTFFQGDCSSLENSELGVNLEL